MIDSDVLPSLGRDRECSSWHAIPIAFRRAQYTNVYILLNYVAVYVVSYELFDRNQSPQRIDTDEAWDKIPVIGNSSQIDIPTHASLSERTSHRMELRNSRVLYCT